jgi:hypothetical protein
MYPQVKSPTYALGYERGDPQGSVTRADEPIFLSHPSMAQQAVHALCKRLMLIAVSRVIELIISLKLTRWIAQSHGTVEGSRMTLDEKAQ